MKHKITHERLTELEKDGIVSDIKVYQVKDSRYMSVHFKVGNYHLSGSASIDIQGIFAVFENTDAKVFADVESEIMNLYLKSKEANENH